MNHLLALLAVAGGSYPANFGGKRHPPLPGRSFASLFTKGETQPPRALHFALFNLNPAVEKPRITRITRITNRFTNSGQFLRAHPQGENSLQRNLLCIREIREIRGFNCFF